MARATSLAISTVRKDATRSATERGARTSPTCVAASNTTNRGRLVVRARLVRRLYPTGKKVSLKELRELNIERDDVDGDWNYVLRPRAHPPA